MDIKVEEKESVMKRCEEEEEEEEEQGQRDLF